MDDLNLLRKKTGMTIGKAWMLMVSCVIVFLLGSALIGGIVGYRNGDSNELVEKGIFIVLLLILFIASLWGFFINKKQIPFFKPSTFFVTLICTIIALAWSYISPIIVDFFPFNETEAENIERMGVEFFLGILLSIFFTFLQIGVIGHGLLKNYLFKEVLFTVAAVSIVMVVPQAVIGLIFQTLILFYIYYRTASFQLPLLMTVIFIVVEDSFKWIWGQDIPTKNYIKIHLIQNDNLYYLGLLIAISIIFVGLFFIKKQTTPIAWQRPEEDEEIAFL